MMSSSREKILAKLSNPSNSILEKFYTSDESPFILPEKDLGKYFKEQLDSISGRCILCKDRSSLINEIKKTLAEKGLQKIHCEDCNIQAILSDAGIAYNEDFDDKNIADASITPCDALSARTGSVIVSSATLGQRQIQIYPPVHIVIAYENQLFDDLPNAFNYIEQQGVIYNSSVFSVITGPSRTADIEKTLILGAHGPKDFFVFLVQNRQS